MNLEIFFDVDLLHLNNNFDKNEKYGGLSKREVEIRRKMAMKFGRQASHLTQPDPNDLKVDSESLY